MNEFEEYSAYVSTYISKNGKGKYFYGQYTGEFVGSGSVESITEQVIPVFRYNHALKIYLNWSLFFCQPGFGFSMLEEKNKSLVNYWYDQISPTLRQQWNVAWIREGYLAKR